MKLIFETDVKSRSLYRHWLSTENPDDLLNYIQSMVKNGEKVEVVDQAKLYLSQTGDLNLVIFDVLMQSPEEAERILREYDDLRIMRIWDPDLYSAQNFVKAVKLVYGGPQGLNAFRRQHRFNWSEKTILGQVALTEIAEDPKAAVTHVKGSFYRGIPAFVWNRFTPWGKRALKNLSSDKESMKWYLENILGRKMSEFKIKKYSTDKMFKTGDKIKHFKFGIGKVKRASAKFIEVAFKDGAKKLVHGQRTP